MQGQFLSGGQYGFFSYVMDLDLKLKSFIDHGVVNNSYDYPNMPKLTLIRLPSAQILLTEFCFSPTLENWTGSSHLKWGVSPPAGGLISSSATTTGATWFLWTDIPSISNTIMSMVRIPMPRMTARKN